MAKEASDLLQVPMAQISWTTPVNAATMNLVLDHLTFTGRMSLGIYPSLDLGSTAMYSVTMQNCVINQATGYGVAVNIATDSPNALKSPIQFQITDSVVQNSNTGLSFIYTSGATPIYVSVLRTQIVNNIGNGPWFNGNSISVLVIDSCEFSNNRMSSFQLVASQGAFQQSGAGQLPPAFNFTNNIVDSNSFGELIGVQNRAGAYLVDHNKITNNQFNQLEWNANATSYFTGDNTGSQTVQPFVISNNVFSCNHDQYGTNYAFFVREVDPSFVDPWTLINNVNGDTTNCPIHALIGSEMVDPINTQKCLPGYFNNLSTGSPDQCVACPPGSFTAQYGASQCTACPPGNFASASASTSCSPCPAGTHARTSGAFVCADCNSGFFASVEGEVVCEKCAAGTCTPSSGAWTSCQAAPCSSNVQIEISLE